MSDPPPAAAAEPAAGAPGMASSENPQPAGPVALINRHVAALWSQHGVRPGPPVGDAEFLRRATLDLAGRVPTVEEVDAFSADPSADKRAKAVDRLLASDGHGEHFADLYMDELVGRAVRVRQRIARPLRRFLVESFRDNRPFDELTMELLAARGDYDARPQVGFVAAAQLGGGDVAALAGKSARLFLGQQIQCAQCHDHPFDARYRQRDFAGFAAYFAGARVRRVRPDAEPGGKNKGPPALVVFDRWNATYDMVPPGETEGQAVAPRFFGRDLVPIEGETRRATVARAIVDSDDFARVTVNRTWYVLTGVAPVEPWDDLGDPGAHPPLLVELAADFAASGYDHRRLVRAIVLSNAYARSSTGGPTVADDPTLPERIWARAAVRTLSADQLFRSLLVATGLDRALRDGGFEGAVARRKNRALREYLFVYDDDTMADVDSFSGSVAQALLLLNGEVTNRGTASGRRAGDRGLVVGRLFDEVTDRDRRIRRLFATAYARGPSPTELETARAFVEEAGGSRRAYEDLFYALLTSVEFATNH